MAGSVGGVSPRIMTHVCHLTSVPVVQGLGQLAAELLQKTLPPAYQPRRSALHSCSSPLRPALVANSKTRPSMQASYPLASPGPSPRLSITRPTRSHIGRLPACLQPPDPVKPNTLTFLGLSCLANTLEVMAEPGKKRDQELRDQVLRPGAPRRGRLPLSAVGAGNDGTWGETVLLC